MLGTSGQRAVCVDRGKAAMWWPEADRPQQFCPDAAPLGSYRPLPNDIVQYSTAVPRQAQELSQERESIQSSSQHPDLQYI